MYVIGGYYGYDGIRDYLLVDLIDDMKDMNEKLNQIKLLYNENKENYFYWKKWVMSEGELSDVFGTLDDPIEIDESKL